MTNITDPDWHYIDVFRIIRSAGRKDVDKAQAIARYVANCVKEAVTEKRENND